MWSHMGGPTLALKAARRGGMARRAALAAKELVAIGRFGIRALHHTFTQQYHARRQTT